MRRALAFAVLAAALLAGPGQAQDRFGRPERMDDQPPPGNYFRTCRDITVFDFGPNATMTAQCRDETGRWRDTSARFAGCDRLDNRDGQLICRGGEAGGFRPGPPAGGFRPPSYGSQIVLFSAPNFGGARFQSREEVTNLPREYNDQAVSLKIEGRGA